MRHGVRLGLDPGDARIGVARSDPSGFLATPVETVRRGKGDLARIAALADEDGRGRGRRRAAALALRRRGPGGVKVRAFAGRLAAPGRAGPGAAVDERLTTVSAEAMLRDRGRKGRKRRAVVDQAAAVMILQHALDTERATGCRAGEIVEEDGLTRRTCMSSSSTSDDRRAEGGRRARASAPRCPGAWPSLVAAGRRASAGLLRRSTRGIDVRRGPVRRPDGLPRARAAARSSSRSRRATASPRWAAA